MQLPKVVRIIGVIKNIDTEENLLPSYDVRSDDVTQERNCKDRTKRKSQFYRPRLGQNGLCFAIDHKRFKHPYF